ncbi:MAG: hypothetical protein O3A37_08930 [Planctomycetota bacterium]|nr:hypothetical protein [Planctomycetota bacterium]
MKSVWQAFFLRSALAALLLAPLAAIHAAEPVTIDLSKRTWQGIPGLERGLQEEPKSPSLKIPLCFPTATMAAKPFPRRRRWLCR